MMTHSYDRRHAGRVTRQMDVVYAHGGCLRRGKLLSLSATGARILFRDPVSPNLPVLLQIDEGADIELHVETVWSEPLRGGSEIRGLRFRDDVSSQLAAALRPRPIQLVSLPAC